MTVWNMQPRRMKLLDETKVLQENKFEMLQLGIGKLQIVGFCASKMTLL